MEPALAAAAGGLPLDDIRVVSIGNWPLAAAARITLAPVPRDESSRFDIIISFIYRTSYISLYRIQVNTVG